MAYFITLSNGASQIIINDETIDTTTSLTLIGRNTIGIGQIINSNEVHQLENFASPAAPANPMIGQIWYNSQTQVMMVCTGNNPTAAWAPITQVAGFSGNITISDLKQAGLAALDSPAFGGIPTTPTPDGTNAQQIATVGYVASQLPPTRIRLTANKSFYIANSGSDVNDGLTTGTAWATLQHAYDTLQQGYDLNGFTVKFNIAAGSYVGVQMTYPLVGQKAQPAVEWAGAGAATVINATSSGIGSFVVLLGAGTSIHDLAISNSNNVNGNFSTEGYGIYADQDSYVLINNITFGACGQSQICAAHGATILTTVSGSVLTVTGDAQAFMQTVSSGSISCPEAHIVFNNTVTYAQATVYANIYGYIGLQSATFTNPSNVNGPRYISDLFAVVNTGGGGPSFIPGNSPGVLNSSGFGAAYL
jgi:hypothetical protein